MLASSITKLIPSYYLLFDENWTYGTSVFITTAAAADAAATVLFSQHFKQ